MTRISSMCVWPRIDGDSIRLACRQSLRIVTEQGNARKLCFQIFPLIDAAAAQSCNFETLVCSISAGMGQAHVANTDDENPHFAHWPSTHVCLTCRLFIEMHQTGQSTGHNGPKFSVTPEKPRGIARCHLQCCCQRNLKILDTVAHGLVHRQVGPCQRAIIQLQATVDAHDHAALQRKHSGPPAAGGMASVTSMKRSGCACGKARRSETSCT